MVSNCKWASWTGLDHDDTPVSFDLEILSAGASEFLQCHRNPPLRRLVTLCELTSDAMVLGSTQNPTQYLIDFCKANSLNLVKRASGGTGVILRKAQVIWIDVGLPANDPLLELDLSRSFNFLALAWLDALKTVGIDQGQIHAGKMRRSLGFSQVCFAGVGPGEILVGERKLVGMAQRRSDHGAYFHTMAYLEFPIDLTYRAFVDSSTIAMELLQQSVTDIATVLGGNSIGISTALASALTKALSTL